MSKIIYAAFKSNTVEPLVLKDIQRISKKLIPDNITPKPPILAEMEGVAYGIINPVRSIEIKNKSVLLGKVFEETSDWWRPKTAKPDGTYALFRSDEEFVELVSDSAGSRSIWYYHDDEKLIASTSQRAIIIFLKSFSFNKNVLPWILSTGSIGPFLSWDSRIKLLPPNSSLLLDRCSWSFRINTTRVNFCSFAASDTKHKEMLTGALTETFSSINLNYSNWSLPLSGGYDSRSILTFLKEVGKDISNLKSITWGLKNSITIPDNDAYIAHKVASYYKIDHKYYHTDLSEEPIEDLFNRFLICGEGRIDHFGGYLDGFKIWKTLFEDNVEGIIRGDIGFSSVAADSPYFIRKNLGIGLCTDFSNLSNYETFGFEKQELPDFLKQRNDETLASWRDRLYHEYRIPIVLAALNDLKLPFVEIVNPLLSQKINNQIRKLPDHLRNNKKLFKSIASSIGPPIHYAKSSATAVMKNILKSESIVNMIQKVLRSEEAKLLFPEKFIEYILSNVKIKHEVDNNKLSLKARVVKIMPKWLKNRPVSNSIKPNVDFNIVAFRMYIACRMYSMLCSDTQDAETTIKTVGAGNI